MTSRHYRAACAVVAALIVATLGAILGHAVAPPWWTLTAAVVCGGVAWLMEAAVNEWTREQAVLSQPVPYHVAGRAEVRRPSHYIYGYRSAA